MPGRVSNGHNREVYDLLTIIWAAALIYLVATQSRLSRRISRLEERLEAAGSPATGTSDTITDTVHLDASDENGPKEESTRAAEISEEFATVPPTEKQDTTGDEGSLSSEPVPEQFEPSDTDIPFATRREHFTEAAGDQPARSVEETLTSTWLIWVGTIAVALSAVFLFRYAVDQGWLTPLARVIMGLLLGGFLLAAGEWAVRNPVEAVRRAMNPDYVPAALSGTGIFAIYVSVFAAHAIFGLLSPAQAFVTLGLTSYSAVALSLRQGPFVALVGLVAGYLVPQLVIAPEPQALPLFIYLFVLTAGCLLVMVWRKWWWFAYLTMAGAFTWPSLWLISSWTLADQGTLGAYCLGLALLFAVLSTGLEVKRSAKPLLRWIGDIIADTSGLGFVLSGLMLLWLAVAAGFNASAFLFIGLYGLAALGLSAWRASLERLVVASAFIAIAVALLWPDPARVTPITEIESVTRGGFSLFAVPPEYRTYLNALLYFTGLYAFGGFLGALRGRTPVVWAGVANLFPLIMITVAYWRVGNLETDVSWAGLAATMAVLATAAAAILARRRNEDPQGDMGLALFAAGATAALALAFTCLLREAWLTVALSVETLALAWIWSRLPMRELRLLAASVTVVVIIRLAANPMILDYEGEVLGLFGWVLYGYGIPAASTLLAARIFARSDRDQVVTLCEIAGVGFAFLMVALQLRLWTSGAIVAPHWHLFDQSVQTLWWLTSSALLLFEANRGKRKWTYLAGLGLLALSVATIYLVHVFVQSPLFSGEMVGRLPVLNLLGFAYALPAAMLFAMASLGSLRLDRDLRTLLKYSAGPLLLVYITLETRRAFWGTDIGLSLKTQPSNAEFYTYSAVWIAFALFLLAVGILRRSGPLRYASLAVLMITVLKVFLFDMSDLTGLFRVASFLGLGLTLIGIGRVYQRYVFGPRKPRGPAT